MKVLVGQFVTSGLKGIVFNTGSFLGAIGSGAFAIGQTTCAPTRFFCNRFALLSADKCLAAAAGVMAKWLAIIVVDTGCFSVLMYAQILVVFAGRSG